VIQRLLEPGRQLDAEVIVVTGGMPDAAARRLRDLGVKVILNKADGMSAVVDRCGRPCGGVKPHKGRVLVAGSDVRYRLAGCSDTGHSGKRRGRGPGLPLPERS